MASRFSQCEMGLLRGGIGGRNLRPLLVDLFTHGVSLESADAGIGEIGLCRCQRPARRFETAAGSGHGGTLLIGGRRCLLTLTFGNGTGLHQFLISVVVELGQTQGSFLLGKIGLGGGQIGLGLPYAPGCVHFGLLRHQLVLLQLLFVNGNLIGGRFGSGIRASQSGTGLVFTRADLGVVKKGKGIAGFDSVAFAHADFDDAALGFRRDGGIVAFDAPAQRDNAVGNTRVGEVASPERRRRRHPAPPRSAEGASGVGAGRRRAWERLALR